MAVVIVGNCQMQYLAGHLVTRGDEKVHVFGERYGAILRQPRQPIYEPARAFAGNILKLPAEARDLLIVQQSPIKRYWRVADQIASEFRTVVHFPYMHYRAPWPEFRMRKPRPISERYIARAFEFEKQDFVTTMTRCGLPDFDHAAYWEQLRTACSFYHPGHPTAELFIEMISKLRPVWENQTDAVDLHATVELLRGATGISSGAMHPITPMAAEALDIPWAKGPHYRMWRKLEGLSPRQPLSAEDCEELRRLLDSCDDALGTGVAAHFTISAARALWISRADPEAVVLTRRAAEVLDYPMRAVLAWGQIVLRAKAPDRLSELLDRLGQLALPTLLQQPARLLDLLGALRQADWAQAPLHASLATAAPDSLLRRLDAMATEQLSEQAS